MFLIQSNLVLSVSRLFIGFILFVPGTMLVRHVKLHLINTRKYWIWLNNCSTMTVKCVFSPAILSVWMKKWVQDNVLKISHSAVVTFRKSNKSGFPQCSYNFENIRQVYCCIVKRKNNKLDTKYLITAFNIKWLELLICILAYHCF